MFQNTRTKNKFESFSAYVIFGKKDEDGVSRKALEFILRLYIFFEHIKAL